MEPRKPDESEVVVTVDSKADTPSPPIHVTVNPSIQARDADLEAAVPARDLIAVRDAPPQVINMGAPPAPKSRGAFLVSGLLKVAAGTALLFSGEALNTQVTTPPNFYAPPGNSTVTDNVGQSVGYSIGNTTNWNMQYIGGVGIGLGISDLMEVVKPKNVLSAFTTGVINMVANPKNAFNDPAKTFMEGYNEVRNRPTR